MAEKRQPISPRAAVQYQERWTLVQRRLTEELRTTSMETKLLHLAALMASAREMEWSVSLEAEDNAVRDRWMALKRTKLGKA